MPLPDRHTHNINNPIDLKNEGSDLDFRYGPYESVQDALNHFPYINDPQEGILTLRGVGRTVLILDGEGEQQEYWFYGGIEDEHLVPKNSGVSIHNSLEEIQGGKPATETEEAEYYHLNQNQYNSLVAMLYNPKTVSFGVSPVNGEKGVDAALTLNYNITANDDSIVSADINQGIGNVALMSGSVSGGTKKATTSYILTISYKDNLDVAKISNHTTSYNAYVPQWYGFHKNDDITTYADLSSYLTKVIQSSSTIQQSVSPNNDYIYFVVTKGNAKIFDQNNFEQTVGTWGDGVSEFYKKSIIVTLQDNTTETLFVYRTRNMKTITQPFIYKIQ